MNILQVSVLFVFTNKCFDHQVIQYYLSYTFINKALDIQVYEHTASIRIMCLQTNNCIVATNNLTRVFLAICIYIFNSHG